MVLSIDIATLIGFGCESVLYGVYCVLFLISINLQLWPRNKQETNKILLGANVLIFLSCTAHYALEFEHFYTTLQSTGVVGYATETTRLLGADTMISVIDFFGEMVLVYRCWLMWKKDIRVVVIPTITAFAALACTCVFAQIIRTLDPAKSTPPHALVPLGLAGYSLALGTNVILTMLIIGRIWWISRWDDTSVLPPMSATTRRAVAIIIESGALYVLIQTVFLALYALQNTAEAIVVVMACQIYGIAPTLIIIRVGLGTSNEKSVDLGAITPVQWYSSRDCTTGSATVATVNDR